MRKKLRDWVRPGVDEVRARPRTASNEFNRLDLPTFERPRKAISGLGSRGQSTGLKALFRNSALAMRMLDREVRGTGPRRPPTSVRKLSAGGLRLRALGHHGLNHLDALPDFGQRFFAVRGPADELFEVTEHVRSIPCLAQFRENRFDLREYEKVLAVCFIEH